MSLRRPHDEAAQAKLDKEDQAASMKEAEKLATKHHGALKVKLQQKVRKTTMGGLPKPSSPRDYVYVASPIIGTIQTANFGSF